MKTGVVHHGEHASHAGVDIADQIGSSSSLLAVGHHAGGAGVDAQLVLDADALDIVAVPEAAVGIDQVLGYEEQRDPPGSRRSFRCPCQYEMDDVVRHLVLAPSDEDLGSLHPPGPVVLLPRLSPQCADVRSCLGFGKRHGAGPFTSDEFLQVAGIELF